MMKFNELSSSTKMVIVGTAGLGLGVGGTYAFQRFTENPKMTAARKQIAAEKKAAKEAAKSKKASAPLEQDKNPLESVAKAVGG